MSEQRFKLQHINDLTDQEYMRLKKITDNGELITLGEVVDLLNALHQENQKLQEKIMKVKQSNNHYYTEYYRIKEENEQLKKYLKIHNESELSSIEYNLKLYEENKYLKKRIKVISDELYCKDRKLEELGVPIECCDKK